MSQNEVLMKYKYIESQVYLVYVEEEKFMLAICY